MSGTAAFWCKNCSKKMFIKIKPLRTINKNRIYCPICKERLSSFGYNFRNHDKK